MGLGFAYVSVMENAGISTGNPPACHTPRFTASARSRKCAWHGLISLHVLIMAMTGRPVKSSWRNPDCFIRERWLKARMVSGPNQRKLRRSSGRFFGGIAIHHDHDNDRSLAFIRNAGGQYASHEHASGEAPKPGLITTG